MSIYGEVTTATIDIDAYAKITYKDSIAVNKVAKSEDITFLIQFQTKMLPQKAMSIL